MSDKCIFEKLITVKDDSSDIYFCISGFCGYPVMKSSNLTCFNNLTPTLLPPPTLKKLLTLIIDTIKTLCKAIVKNIQILIILKTYCHALKMAANNKQYLLLMCARFQSFFVCVIFQVFSPSSFRSRWPDEFHTSLLSQRTEDFRFQ